MTAVHPADSAEAAALTAYLARLIHWDKAAVVRVQGAGQALAVFGRPPFGEVLSVRTCRLAEPVEVDATVSAGQLLDALDAGGTAAPVTVPPQVTGPAWAGLLPPRGGWRRTAELRVTAVRAAAAGVVAEFRSRTEALAPQDRTRAELDALAEEIWSRELPGTGLPLRAVHAAHALGFLRPLRATAGTAGPGGGAAPLPPEPADEARTVALLASGPWLRLGTPYGSVAVRGGRRPGLAVSPV